MGEPKSQRGQSPPPPLHPVSLSNGQPWGDGVRKVVHPNAWYTALLLRDWLHLTIQCLQDPGWGKPMVHTQHWNRRRQ